VTEVQEPPGEGGSSSGDQEALTDGLILSETSRRPERFIGIGGKSYPARLRNSRPREYLFDKVHELRHVHKLSQPLIVATLVAEGSKISQGTVSNYLREPCPDCGDQR
jgi:hypothetical protein